MTTEKKKRLTRAVGFLSGVIASLDAVRDQKNVWPPSDLWEGLGKVQRVELGAGIALIFVSVVLMITRRRPEY
jgi:hypothetical protein